MSDSAAVQSDLNTQQETHSDDNRERFVVEKSTEGTTNAVVTPHSNYTYKRDLNSSDKTAPAQKKICQDLTEPPPTYSMESGNESDESHTHENRLPATANAMSGDALGMSYKNYRN